MSECPFSFLLWLSVANMFWGFATIMTLIFARQAKEEIDKTGTGQDGKNLFMAKRFPIMFLGFALYSIGISILNIQIFSQFLLTGDIPCNILDTVKALIVVGAILFALPLISILGKYMEEWAEAMERPLNHYWQ